MAARRSLFWPIVTIVITVLVVTIALPQSWKGWAPSFLQKPGLHLGLDLVGGTQLDFRISEEELNNEEKQVAAQIAAIQSNNGSSTELSSLQAQQQSLQQQHQNLVEAIRTVLERRINALGVSEANITPSYVGNEKHLLVECPGVVNTQECIDVVGKTIQLEFKEEFTQPTEDFKQSVRKQASDAMRRITQSGQTLQAIGQDLGDKLGVTYQDSHLVFKDQLPAGLTDVWSQPQGKIVQREGSVTVQQQDQTGKLVKQDVPGVFLVQVTGPLTETGRVINEAPKAFSYLSKTMSGTSYFYHEDYPLDTKVPQRVVGAIRGMQAGELKAVATTDTSADLLFLRQLVKGKEEVDVSHILVAYKGAPSAGASVTRTKADALKRAQDLKAKLTAGVDFSALAKSSSDGPSAKDGGSLGTISRGEMPPSFESIAFSLAPGKVSDPIETQYGYHLIRVNKAVTMTPDIASYDDLTVNGQSAFSRVSDLVTKLQAGQVRSEEQAVPLRTLFFSLLPSGWKDTALDGKHFRTAGVSIDPVTNVPVVQIAFDDEGAKLFNELTKANIGKRIAIFVGGQLVSAPMVQQEITGGTAVITGSANVAEAQKLAQDLNTGAIPAPIYLVGQYTVEATLGAAALQTSLLAAFIGTIILMVYMIVVYRVLGLMADIALFSYAVIVFAILKLPLLLVTSNYVVLSLAGMAGIILSIGMAVDANVLVFERMKEELRKGKAVKTSIETSFKHAWPAIRDGHVSAIITCAILFLIGTSIIRGFAITLGLGVILSLFTSVTITRWLLRRLAASSYGERRNLFPGGSAPNASAGPADTYSS